MSAGERVCLTLTLVGGCMAAAPFAADDLTARMGTGRFALAVIGLIMALSGFVCFFLFRSRNRVMRELQAGRGLLAKWTYTEREWRAFAGEELGRQAGNQGALLLVTAIFMLIATTVAFARDRGAGLFVGMIMLVLWIVCVIVVRVTLRSSAVAQPGRIPEASIGRDGLLLGDEMHLWNGWGNSFGECVISDGATQVLVISYKVPSGNATVRRTQVVRVPVPSGRESEAADVVRQLGK